MDRLKSEMIIEQKKVKYFQDVLERTQQELENIRVYVICLPKLHPANRLKHMYITLQQHEIISS